MKKFGLLTIFLFVFTGISFAQTANDYFLKGNELFKQKKWVEAEQAYTECVRLSPNYTNCYFNRGLARQIGVGYGLALEDFTKAISLDPNYAKAYKNRGEVYAGMKRYDEAVTDLKKAISIDSRYALAYYTLADVYSKKENDAEAIYNYTQAITYNPTYATAYTFRGLIYKKQKKLNEAISDFTMAVSLDPNDGLAFYHRGEIYFDQNKLETAEADFQKAIALDKVYERLISSLKLSAKTKALLEKTQTNTINNPSSDEVYKQATQIFIRGNTNYNNRNYEVAIADYSEYIKIYPNSPDAYYNRGLANGNLGKKDLAIADLRQTLKLKADFPNAQNELNKILALAVNENNTPELKQMMDDALKIANQASSARTTPQINSLHQTALEKYNLVITKYPNYANAYGKRAYVYESLSEKLTKSAEKNLNLIKAIEDYGKAILMGANNEYFHFSRAKLNLRRVEEGASLMTSQEKANLIDLIILDTNTFLRKDNSTSSAANIYYFRGKANLIRGDKDSAIKDFQASIRIKSSENPAKNELIKLGIK